MTISEILDTMDDMLEKAWNLPLTGGKCIVDIDKMQDLISDIRLYLPKEIKQAKMIVSDRQDILTDAKQEANQMIANAEKKANQMVSENEITKAAQTKANQMVAQAHEQSVALKKMTNHYVENLLTDSEEMLVKTLQELKSAHSELRKGAKSNQ